MQGMQLLAGIDEAGRGPLAGPVYAAAVILDPAQIIIGLQDSKKLSEKQREHLFAIIQAKALAWSIARAEVTEIDEINILQATFLAMRRAVCGLQVLPQGLLIDGNQDPKLNYPTKLIIQGDQTEPAISAASILAKVARDREMQRLDHLYPDYGFAKHKGYGTKQHLAALKQYGICDLHRRSYAPVAEIMMLGVEN